MSLIGGNLIVYLTADTTQYERGMSKAKKQTDSFRDSAKIAAGVLMRDLVRGLTQGAIAALKMGAQIQTLKNSFDSLSRATGEYVPTLAELRRATHGMVSDTDLLLRANEALALGIPTENLDELFDAAVRLGKAMGIDATQGIQALTIGVGRQSRLVLDNLGIIVRAEDAYEEYARAVGKTAETLTDSERRIAFQTVALEKITEKAAILGDNISETDRVMDQWNATIKNVTTGIGELLGPLGKFTPIFTALAPAISIIAVQHLPRLAASLYGVLPSIVAVETALIPLVLPLVAIGAALVALKIAWDTNFGGIRDATAEVVAILEKHFGTLDEIIKRTTENLESFFKLTKGTQDVIRGVQTLISGPTPTESTFDPFAPRTTPTTSRRGIYRGTSVRTLSLEELKAIMTPPEYQDWLIRKGLIDETAQHGFSGIVSKPTVILAGEAGPEMVNITPLNKGITPSATAPSAPSGGGGYSPTFVFNIDALTGDRAGAQRLGQLTAEEHLNELRRRGKTL